MQEQFELDLDTRRHVWTVSEVNTRIRWLLDREFGDVWVAGEISGVRFASSGHYYFTLKDGESQIRCACFRMSARYLKFKPQDGVAVVARGRLDVYDARGEYQLLVEFLEPRGYGALQLAFEQLKKKLADEGLFDPSRRKPLPRYPQRIGIVTSPDGAVIRDMLSVLCRRMPGIHVRVWPALVQGEGSIEQISRGVRFFSTSEWADVTIVARGGGSLEDLWTFNEEAVARTIAGSNVPVVSAVGHETDFTIADFVADLRAPTPSAAAELVVPSSEALLDCVAGFHRRLEQAARWRVGVAARTLHERGVERAATVLHRRIGRLAQRSDELERCAGDSMRRHLRNKSEALRALDARLRRLDLQVQVSAARTRFDNLRAAAVRAIEHKLRSSRSEWQPHAIRLEQLSPLAVLQRGYALVRSDKGELVRSPGDAPAGTRLRVRVAEGEFEATAD
ncbi:MAG TPA: exodeoxyribonuclease VII large subunit [Bryobacteraceae bacterium]|nr:exodeoxyribonuclease VII large subunit [Bryobacteraceae bacterium]